MQINTAIQYETEIHNVLLGNKTIKIESITPKYTATEEKRVKQIIEESLYNIFKKYQ